MAKRAPDQKSMPVSLLSQAAHLSEAEIDVLYGLEPVYEAGADPRLLPMGQFVSVRCPHCFERYDSDVETIYGSFDRVEDCQVCCRPIHLFFDIADGAVKRLRVERVD